jgi:hypothetical protein
MIIGFILTMPNIGSWNGKWSGSKSTYYRSRHFSKKDFMKSTLKDIDLEKGDNFYYSFGDGWGANIEVKIVDVYTNKKLTKLSKGFCGYDWMIDSILSHGKILSNYPEEKVIP